MYCAIAAIGDAVSSEGIGHDLIAQQIQRRQGEMLRISQNRKIATMAIALILIVMFFLVNSPSSRLYAIPLCFTPTATPRCKYHLPFSGIGDDVNSVSVIEEGLGGSCVP